MKQVCFLFSLFFGFLLVAGCAGTQPGEAGGDQSASRDMIPLEDNRALEIVSSVLREKNMTVVGGVVVQMDNDATLTCDMKIEGHPIAVEYLGALDNDVSSSVPAASAGSRLHVVGARVVEATPDSSAGDAVYVFIMDRREYRYQPYPTSDDRAAVTLREVSSRIRRDLLDFLSWYESTLAVPTP